MKKFLYVFIFCLLLIPQEIFAETAQKRSLASLCSYVFDKKNGQERVDIYVENGGTWALYHYDSGNSKTLKKGKFDDVFADGGDIDIKIADSYKNNLLNLVKCPEVLVYDYEWANSLCFSDKPDGGNCKDNDDDFYKLQFGIDYMIDLHVNTQVLQNLENFLEENLDNYDGDAENFKENFQLLVDDVISDSITQEYMSALPEDMKNILIDKVKNSDLINDFNKKVDEKIQEKKESYEVGSTEYLELEKLESEIKEKPILTSDNLDLSFKDILDKISISPLNDCESLLGSPDDDYSPAWFLTLIFMIVRYVALGILIVMTILDFVSATASHDNDILKKAFNKAIMRFVICIIIWLLPTFIKLFLSYIDNIPNDMCIK